MQPSIHITEEEEENLMIKKLFIFFIALVFTAPAFAGNIPEFDAVGLDSANVFNDLIKDMVVANNINANGWIINDLSAFPRESFNTSAAGPRRNPCFFDLFGYQDYKATPWTQNFFQWDIVLQMQPETDLNVNIRDCILKQNQTDIWFYAQQAGRYRQANEYIRWIKSANPSITVRAIPGPRQFPGAQPFGMTARRMPTLNKICLEDQLYTSKALWEEGLVIEMPEPGQSSRCGGGFVLREGDLISVRVTVPFNNVVDLWYGPDNVVIKYVGILGTDYTTNDGP